MAANVIQRITRLRELIDHPRTGAAERAAAQRMLDRILSRSSSTARSTRTGDRSYGPRYDRVGRHASLEDIAESIRQDIAFARVFPMPAQAGELTEPNAVRDAPAEITYTVETPYDGTILITMGNVPTAWGRSNDQGRESVSPAVQALAEELADLMNSYNHDGDQIGKRFFGKVRVGETTLVWG
ncbi:hypothetical protein [Nocardia sp. NPDC127526]|uniref:hypothetical protein n=1 Tax=Nocardia sp. NPDC127526 TaxID=3345393 RepID=UPI00362F533F